MKNDEQVAAFIEHYGVKGMRWGVRKARTSSAGKKPPRPSSSESKKVSELRRRKAHQLTNKQLQTVNTRVNLESNYNRLNPSSIKRGAMFAAAVLGAAQTASTVYNLTQSPAGKAAIANGRKAMEKKRKQG